MWKKCGKVAESGVWVSRPNVPDVPPNGTVLGQIIVAAKELNLGVPLSHAQTALKDFLQLWKTPDRCDRRTSPRKRLSGCGKLGRILSQILSPCPTKIEISWDDA